MRSRLWVAAIAVAVASTFAVAQDDQKEIAKKINEEARLAEEALTAKKWDEAASHYEKFFADFDKLELPEAAKKNIEKRQRYNYACVLALLGKKEPALEQFGKAVDAGFHDWKHIAEDTDLDSIRNEDAFKKAIERGKDADKKAADAEVKMPFNPFSKAKEGDWVVFSGSAKQEGGKSQKLLNVWRLTKVDGADLTVEIENKAGGQPKVLHFNGAKTPTVKAYMGLVPTAGILEPTTEDTKVTVGGKEFTGKKFKFTAMLGEGESAVITMVMSPEVTMGGRVTMHAELKSAKNPQTTLDYEVAGFGSGDKATWGKTIAELEKEAKGGAK